MIHKHIVSALYFTKNVVLHTVVSGLIYTCFRYIRPPKTIKHGLHTVVPNCRPSHVPHTKKNVVTTKIFKMFIMKGSLLGKILTWVFVFLNA